MTIELLTPAQMAEADRLTIASGIPGIELMHRAGAAVTAEVLRRFPEVEGFQVLCGPGNNGGDGYVIARLLADAGASVEVWTEGEPRAGSDAEACAIECEAERRNLAEYQPRTGWLVVDALYGAGLSKPLGAQALAALERVKAAKSTVVAVDLPSGVNGETGKVLGSAFNAALTVTFARKKPGHLLYPGRAHCGEVAVADVGITRDAIAATGAACFENQPPLWLDRFPKPEVDAHKYSRGHAGVFSGGPASTGAARLSALAAARAGAGAVTLLSPANALQVNAAHLTSIILRRADSADDAQAFLQERKPRALVYGPGLGPQDETAARGLDLMGLAGQHCAVVFDADAITALGRHQAAFFTARSQSDAPPLVLTPHGGEFARLFPDLAGDEAMSKVEQARAAARRANAVIVFKGPDTVIAAPDGRAAINSNGTALLATAGSGDVLSGIVAGLISQGMPPFEASCAAVWIHAEAASTFGPGLIAEDLPGQLPAVLRALVN